MASSSPRQFQASGLQDLHGARGVHGAWIASAAAVTLLVVFLATANAALASSLTVSWADNSSDESGFSIESSMDGVIFAEIATTPADTTNHKIDGLEPDTTYWFRVRAFNDAGYSEYSNVASGETAPLPVSPAFVSQPDAVHARTGQSVAFSVEATGEPQPSIQWFKDGVAIPGATGSLLTLEPVQPEHAGLYTAEATNGSGSVMSEAAELVVDSIPLPGAWDQPPTISGQPEDVVRPVGGQARFEVIATGDPQPTYQWFKDGAPLAGATGAALVLENVQPGDAGVYFARVGNTAGMIDSVHATLTVTTVLPTPLEPQAPEIVQHPQNASLSAGADVAFSVEATGVPEPTFQWKKDGLVLPGATASVLTLSGLRDEDAGVYSVAVSNSEGSVESLGATLTVISEVLPMPGLSVPKVVMHTDRESVVAGDRVVFEVTSVSEAGATYQWLKDGMLIEGATASTLTFEQVALSDAGLYSVRKTLEGDSVESVAIELTVADAGAPAVLPVIVAQPQGTSALRWSRVKLAVLAEGAVSGYQWYRGNPGDVSNPVEGAVRESLDVEVGTSSLVYWVRVASEAGPVDSDAARITVVSNPMFASGGFGNDATNRFAILVRGDGLADLVALLPDGQTVIDASGIEISDSGSFSFEGKNGLTVTGRLAGGRVVGEVLPIGARFGGELRDALSGATADLSGAFRGSILGAGEAGSISILASADSRAFALIRTAAGVSASWETISESGDLMLPLGVEDQEVAVRLSPDGILSGDAVIAGATQYVNGVRVGGRSAGFFSNMSVRASAGDREAIVTGFVVSGTGEKRVLVRGVGPTLASFGVVDPLQNPRLTLYRRGLDGAYSVEGANDDWRDAPNRPEIEAEGAAVGAFTLPSDSGDSAMLSNLAAGEYTAHVDSAESAGGAAIVELYDVGAARGAPLDGGICNISVKAPVLKAGDVVIVGFVVTGETPVHALIRAVGNELEQFGEASPLEDPLLTVYRHQTGDEAVIAANDDWTSAGPTLASLAEELGAFPLQSGSGSAGLDLWLEPGVYTVQASSVSASGGVVLVEVYGVK